LIVCSLAVSVCVRANVEDDMRAWWRVALGGATCVLAGLASAGPRAEETEFGDPLPGLTPEQRALFQVGMEQFEDEENAADGLGPVFNDVACGACHDDPVPGGSGAIVETRFGATRRGRFDPLTELGGTLLQAQGIGPVPGGCDFVGEVVPPQANVVAGRRTQPLFGLGLVDAVPDRAFYMRAFAELFDRDHIAGRVAVVDDPRTGRPAVGKFGWKAQLPTIFTFSADAYLNEMGITTPLFPAENCPQGDCSLLRCDPVPDPEDDGDDLQAFTDFITLLAPPPTTPPDLTAVAGAMVFLQIGCAGCHQPMMMTGPNAIAALDRVAFFPYSDFLLHDMGALGDGIAQAGAGPREMRTAPLWGVSAQSTFLHDGRAATLTDAIRAHDGQGRRARDRFDALSRRQRDALLAFLRTI
jgi:CxxC motif-containing protein (DUF1111 family)